MPATTKPAVDPLSGGQEMTTQQVGFNQIGDFVKGTYTNKKFVESKGVNLYELKGKLGIYHKDDAEVSVQPGAFYNVWGGKTAIDDLFSRSKLGDIVAIQFKDESPSKTKGNSPFKIFKTLTFGHDKEYMGEDSDTTTLEDAANEAFPPKE